VISRRFPVWQKLVALAPLLLVAVYLPGQAMLRCRMDGLLRPTCCCPQQGEPQYAGTVVQAQDCCDREVSDSEAPAVEAARRAEPALGSAVAVMPSSATAAPTILPIGQDDRAAQRYGPAREGPPLVLLKHAFLI
jgi:hypothetical protein